MRHYDFKIKFLRNNHSNARRINFSVKRIAESNVENAQNNVLGHFGEKSESHIHFLISISDSKDNIAEDTLVHVHFNKIHMKPFVKPRKQSKGFEQLYGIAKCYFFAGGTFWEKSKPRY